MAYIKHRILKTGHIEIKETSNRFVVSPNQPLEKYNEIIEADKDWKYRTKENADAYEAILVENTPSEQEQLEQWRATAKLTRLQFMLGVKRYSFGDGTLKEAIDALITSLKESGNADYIKKADIMQDSLDTAGVFNRNSQDLNEMAEGLSMTPEQVDDFFKWAEAEEWRSG